MAKPVLPVWATTGAILTPIPAKQATGWVAGEEPPCEYMNWIQNLAYLWDVYFNAKTENISPLNLRSASTVSWNGSVLTFGSNLQIVFRSDSNPAQINQFTAGTLTLADGDVVVVNRDKSSASPVTLATHAYPGLTPGTYAIIPESSLTNANIENELILFRRNGSNLEIPNEGLIYATGTTWTIGAVNNNHSLLNNLLVDTHTQYILVNGTRAFTGNQSMGGFRLTNLLDPSAAQDAATKAYVDSVIPPVVTFPISVAHGGTNSTAFTAGSIVFAGAGGTTLTEDNTHIFWDNSTKRLGIGTNSPSHIGHFYSSSPSQIAVCIENSSVTGENASHIYKNVVSEWHIGNRGSGEFALNYATGAVTVFDATASASGVMRVYRGLQYRSTAFTTFTPTLGTGIVQEPSAFLKCAIFSGTLNGVGDMAITIPTGLTIWGGTFSLQRASSGPDAAWWDIDVFHNDNGEWDYNDSTGELKYYSNNASFPDCAFKMIIWYT